MCNSMSKEKIISPYIEVGEFKSIVLKQIRILSREITFRCRYPENYKELQSYIYPNDFSWSQKLFHYINSDLNFELGKCVVCNNRCNFLSVTRGYSKYCSKECYGNDYVNWKTKEILNMSKEDILDLLNNHPNGYIEEYKFKKIFPKHYNEIMKWKFPYDFKWTQKLFHYFNNDPELKLGLCPVCGNRCKFYRFGEGYKKHCSKLCKSLDVDVQERTKKTNLIKYGKEVYTQTDLFKNQSIKTSLEKYGYEHPQQSQIVKNKARETCEKKYGDITFSKTPKWKEMVVETNRRLFGNDFYTQTNEYKERYKLTCLEKYGVEHYSQTDEYKEYYKQIMLKSYGVTNFSYTDEFRKNRKKKIKYDGLTFDSSWEVKVYQYCKENNIPCEYQPNIQFEYEYDGKTHIYQPDFFINGKIYEVKGNQFFEGDKMINPYDRTQDGLFEEKHQCMLHNGVIILTKYEIKFLNEFIKK